MNEYFFPNFIPNKIVTFRLRGHGNKFHAAATIFFAAVAQNFVSVSLWLNSCNKNS